jgi:multicomponent Na+:H+ antiporter subunit F
MYLLFTLLLLANIAAAFWFVLRSSDEGDKLLTSLLLTTTGICVLLLLYAGEGESAFLDIALIFALLSAVAGVVFSKRTWRAQ